MVNHVLLEVFCLKNIDEHSNKPLPDFCKCPGAPKYECLFYNCPYMSFTSCENSLCYINEKSEPEEIVSLSEESVNSENLDLWKNLSIDAINNTYKKYMIEKSS